MNYLEKLQTRVNIALAELEQTRERVRRLEKESAKEKRTAPQAHARALQADLEAARANLGVAIAALEAGRRWPPLRVQA